MRAVLSKAASAALMILIAVSMASALAIASQGAGFVERRLYILAVGEAGGKYFGVPSELVVRVGPGTGKVFVSAEPLSELDMQASARIAALVAAFVAGMNYFDYDYYVEIVSNSTIVGGPSAGSAMCVALTAALLGEPLNTSVVVTGMIMPDGLIGPVGGIPEKLHAAAEVGAKVMIVPLGQTRARSLATGQVVDVVEEGRSLGVKVVEASTIYDVLRYFGVKVREPPINISVELPESVRSVMRSWAEESMRQYGDLVREAESIMGQVSDAYKAQMLDLLREAAEYASHGNQSLEDGDYYSAASDYFAATIYADEAVWVGKIVTGQATINDLLSEARTAVDEALSKYGSLIKDRFAGGADASYVTVLAEVGRRVVEANASLTQAEESPSVPDLVYIKWRARSAIDWMDVLDAINASGKFVPVATLKTTAFLMAYFAESVASYVESLTGQSLTTVWTYVEEAKTLADKDPYASLGAALLASARLSAAVNQAFSIEPEGVAAALKVMALRAVSASKERGVEPAVTIAYIQRGDGMFEVGRYSDAISFYDLAVINTVAYTSMIPAGGAPPQTSTPASTGTPTSTLTTTTSGTYGARPPILTVVALIAAALAGFGAGYVVRKA